MEDAVIWGRGGLLTLKTLSLDGFSKGHPDPIDGLSWRFCYFSLSFSFVQFVPFFWASLEDGEFFTRFDKREVESFVYLPFLLF